MHWRRTRTTRSGRIQGTSIRPTCVVALRLPCPDGETLAQEYDAARMPVRDHVHEHEDGLD
jgi:hypothetical protein